MDNDTILQFSKYDSILADMGIEIEKLKTRVGKIEKAKKKN